MACPCRGDSRHRARVDGADDGICRGGEPGDGSAPGDSPNAAVRPGEDLGVVRDPASTPVSGVRHLQQPFTAGRGVPDGAATASAPAAVAGELCNSDLPPYHY